VVAAHLPNLPERPEVEFVVSAGTGLKRSNAFGTTSASRWRAWIADAGSVPSSRQSLSEADAVLDPVNPRWSLAEIAYSPRASLLARLA
jgi:hypothetical protein